MRPCLGSDPGKEVAVAETSTRGGGCSSGGRGGPLKKVQATPSGLIGCITCWSAVACVSRL